MIHNSRFALSQRRRRLARLISDSRFVASKPIVTNLAQTTASVDRYGTRLNGSAQSNKVVNKPLAWLERVDSDPTEASKPVNQ